MQLQRERWLQLARNKDERWFIAGVLDACRLVAAGRPVLTDFLDPGQASLVQQIGGGAINARVTCWGGYPDAERRRCWLEDVRQPEMSRAFGIRALIVTPPANVRLQHRQVLGALLSLGLHRQKIGDIVPGDQQAVALICDSITDACLGQLQRVHRHEVRVTAGDPATLALASPDERLQERVTASLRLDATIAAAFGISRSKAADLVKRGETTVNWRTETRRHTDVAVGDVITVRGHGRFTVKTILGTTRRGRVRLNLAFPAG